MYHSQAPHGSVEYVAASHSHFLDITNPYSKPSWLRTNLDSYTPSYGSSSERTRDLGQGLYSRPSALQNVQPYLEAPVKDGLRTPPSDEMSTAHYPQRSHARSDVQPTQPYSVYNTNAGSYQANISSRHTQDTNAITTIAAPRNSSPAKTVTNSDATQRKSEILPNLQIPSSINRSGGSLPEFAARVTCLFWFESIATLGEAETYSANTVVRRLVPEAIPQPQFVKWVVTILTITQVTPNVILLALLFIYRLKTLNPTVKGRVGSEYRLLTVALMLGNKFLDDNTYTNKTWAEVSGISVGEIHVMEVEFLSNMRYSLLASKDQWQEWQLKLRKFGEYIGAASRVQSSPVATIQSCVLPSPTSIQASPPVYPQSVAAGHTNGHQWSGHFTPSVTHLPPMPDLLPSLDQHSQYNMRKRSYDEASEEPPAKRFHPEQLPLPMSAQQTRSGMPRLPVPNLSIATSQGMTNGHSFTPNMPVLPPLGGRSMSNVYPTTPSYPQQHHDSMTPTIQMTPIHPGSQYGTPSRRHSPRSVAELMSMHSSPISAHFSHAHAQNSPSFFLQQRSSPYKPVLPPHTLLHPPPSASMQGYSGGHEHMQYHPLGRRNDYRTGIVPEYAPNQSYYQPPTQPNFYN